MTEATHIVSATISSILLQGGVGGLIKLLPGEMVGKLSMSYQERRAQPGTVLARLVIKDAHGIGWRLSIEMDKTLLWPRPATVARVVEQHRNAPDFSAGFTLKREGQYQIQIAGDEPLVGKFMYASMHPYVWIKQNHILVHAYIDTRDPRWKPTVWLDYEIPVLQFLGFNDPDGIGERTMRIERLDEPLDLPPSSIEVEFDDAAATTAATATETEMTDVEPTEPWETRDPPDPERVARFRVRVSDGTLKRLGHRHGALSVDRRITPIDMTLAMITEPGELESSEALRVERRLFDSNGDEHVSRSIVSAGELFEIMGREMCMTLDILREQPGVKGKQLMPLLRDMYVYSDGRDDDLVPVLTETDPAEIEVLRIRYKYFSGTMNMYAILEPGEELGKTPIREVVLTFETTIHLQRLPLVNGRFELDASTLSFARRVQLGDFLWRNRSFEFVEEGAVYYFASDVAQGAPFERTGRTGPPNADVTFTPREE